ncbi:hypothetical protein TNCV_2219601 [Trichonephila clavipes]|nr:hypothetical protein TNCV_2219601 [Trichonephila clavipes]
MNLPLLKSPSKATREPLATNNVIFTGKLRGRHLSWHPQRQQEDWATTDLTLLPEYQFFCCCNVASPNINIDRHLCWTRHPHVHLAAAAQLLFAPEESNPLRDLVAALWDKKLAFRTREKRKFWVFTDGPQHWEKKTSLEAMLQLNSASEKESVLLKEDQTDLYCLRPPCPKEKRFSEAVLRLNSASEKESVLLKENQTDL